jgi:hypothetical protein
MPVEIEVDEAKSLVSLRSTGTLGDADLNEIVTRLGELAPRCQGFDLLADVSEADGLPITTHVLRSIAADGPSFGPDSRRAIVVPSELAYGLGRMYSAYADPDMRNLRLFRTREEALEWLAPPSD